MAEEPWWRYVGVVPTDWEELRREEIKPLDKIIEMSCDQLKREEFDARFYGQELILPSLCYVTFGSSIGDEKADAATISGSIEPILRSFRNTRKEVIELDKNLDPVGVNMKAELSLPKVTTHPATPPFRKNITRMERIVGRLENEEIAKYEKALSELALMPENCYLSTVINRARKFELDFKCKIKDYKDVKSKLSTFEKFFRQRQDVYSLLTTTKYYEELKERKPGKPPSVKDFFGE